MKNTLLLTLLAFLIACSTPEKTFNQNDFDGAYKTSLRQLHKNKAIDDNKVILKQLIPIFYDKVASHLF